MLNRRQVRIRAVQTLYAYKRSERANFDLAQEAIANAFFPNLNSMEFQDKELLDAQKKESLAVLQDLLDGKTRSTASTDKILTIARQEYIEYKNRCERDKKTAVLQAVNMAELAYDTHLQILSVFIEIAKIAEPFEHLNARFKFINNPIIVALKNNNNFNHLLMKRNIVWDEEGQNFLKELYREVIKKNERYDEYIAELTHTAEEDFAILKYLLKNVVLKHELSFQYFENIDLYWQENIDTMRVMCTQAFEGVQKGDENPVEQLDDRWLEVRDFMTDLIKLVFENEKQLNELIVPRLKGWELDRIVDTDQHVIRLGLAELMHFPSIPIKVTINEAVDIAKLLNEPKSGTFVNGVLDALAKELIASGQIRKSGRGLIDNR